MLSINAEVKKLMEEANLTAEGWRDWDEQHFFRALYILFPKASTAAFATTVDSIAHQLKTLKFSINPLNIMPGAIKLQQEIHSYR